MPTTAGKPQAAWTRYGGIKEVEDVPVEVLEELRDANLLDRALYCAAQLRSDRGLALYRSDA